MVRIFGNGPWDLNSVLGRVMPKSQKMVLNTSLLNTQSYKEHIESKVEQSWESSVVGIEKGANYLVVFFGS